MPKSVSEQMQDELEPILHDSTERDESDEIEEAKKLEDKKTYSKNEPVPWLQFL